MIPLTLLLLAVPVADEVWITWHFNESCKEAGVHVIRKVKVAGYLNDTSRASPDYARELVITDPSAIRDFDRAGYRFEEQLFTDGKVRHLERVPEGIRVSVLDRPTARYIHRRLYEDEQAGYLLRRTKYVVFDGESEEVLGWRSFYKRYPGWVDSLWMRFLGSGMTMCPDPEIGPKQPQFPEAVLSPMSEK